MMLKTPKNDIFSILHKTLGVISNMTIAFFKIPAQKYANKILVPNLGIYVLAQNFAIRETRGCSFQI